MGSRQWDVGDSFTPLLPVTQRNLIRGGELAMPSPILHTPVVVHTNSSADAINVPRPACDTDQIHGQCCSALLTASETPCRITLVLTFVPPTSFLLSSHPDALRTTHNGVYQRQADACTRSLLR
ncbi:hypothetical protein H0G86_000951 [Trichoderma simmonsii]|uniref:Uncharacterized protein n=1 Tax=Trichoderma simmonsii TaxID=1491479 RepID=A0A8G0L5L4_9HYPO|nr:hypothetical protein H0G86_000951 [Trichoderma simmonsii]